MSYKKYQGKLAEAIAELERLKHRDTDATQEEIREAQNKVEVLRHMLRREVKRDRNAKGKRI
jgi:hypothetical protein